MARPTFLKWQTALSGELILSHSALVRAIFKTMALCRVEGAIELTQTGRFKRKYIDPLARSFDWPHYDIERYYSVSKVMNADDFPPIILVHDFMRHLKLGRHYKGQFKLTKTGLAISQDPAGIFQAIMPAYLFEINHMAFSRLNEMPLGNWDIWLNVLNVSADQPSRLDALYAQFYGPSEDETTNHPINDLYVFYNGVIEPLIWSGLLTEQRPANDGIDSRLIVKTGIWHALDIG